MFYLTKLHETKSQTRESLPKGIAVRNYISNNRLGVHCQETVAFGCRGLILTIENGKIMSLRKLLQTPEPLLTIDSAL